MKRALISLGALLLAAEALAFWLHYRGHQLALRAFRDSREVIGHDTEYAFVTRGVRASMSSEDVEKQMRGAEQCVGLGQIVVGDTRDPYVAYFNYFYRGPQTVLGVKVDKIYISEWYRVYFDCMKLAVRIEYEGVDVAGVSQRIDVDLRQETLSEPLRLQWRE